MNLIGFVFSILLILSFGAIIAFQNQSTAYAMYSTYTGHARAHRILMNIKEKKKYKAILKAPAATAPSETGALLVQKTEEGLVAKVEGGVSQKEGHAALKEELPPISLEHGKNELKQIQPEVKEKITSLPKAAIANSMKTKKSPHSNPSCARINLYGLLHGQEKEKGIEKGLFLRMLKAFYGDSLLVGFPGGAEKFLEEFLKAMRVQMNQGGLPSLEQLKFSDPGIQMLYYRMLKGTKKANLLERPGYPALAQYVKIEPLKTYLCLHHAHANLLCALFSRKSAEKIYQRLHESEGNPCLLEEIEQICRQGREPPLPAELVSLIQLKQCNLKQKGKMLIVAEDEKTEIVLEQSIYVQ